MESETNESQQSVVTLQQVVDHVTREVKATVGCRPFDLDNFTRYLCEINDKLEGCNASIAEKSRNYVIVNSTLPFPLEIIQSFMDRAGARCIQTTRLHNTFEIVFFVN